MEYQQAIDYLYSFPDSEAKLPRTPAEFNLPQTAALLSAFGEPQRALRCVVVAGTKGKGSTATLIEAIARAAGLRTGLWTSPHLHSWRERIQVDRQRISQAEFIAAMQALPARLAGFDRQAHGDPTIFQLGFALALRHFADKQVDLAILEVGLGGRFDSANVVTPLLSVITSISYDHMGILGQTLGEIADNKAGIMKPGVPAITVPQPAEATAVLRREAASVGAPLYVADAGGLAGPGGAEPYPAPPVPGRLRGGFQRENARLAVGAAMLLARQGLPLNAAAIAAGLAEAEWPGRFELIPGAPPILIDGAHNGDSAQKLAAAMRAELSFERLILVLGTSRDKDIAAIAQAIVPPAAAVVITRSTHPRAMDLDRVAEIVRAHARGPLTLAPEIDWAPSVLKAAKRAGLMAFSRVWPRGRM